MAFRWLFARFNVKWKFCDTGKVWKKASNDWYYNGPVVMIAKFAAAEWWSTADLQWEGVGCQGQAGHFSTRGFASLGLIIHCFTFLPFFGVVHLINVPINSPENFIFTLIFWYYRYSCPGFRSQASNSKAARKLIREHILHRWPREKKMNNERSMSPLDY